MKKQKKKQTLTGETSLEKIKHDFMSAQAVMCSGLMDVEKGLLAAIKAFDQFSQLMNNRLAKHDEILDTRTTRAAK